MSYGLRLTQTILYVADMARSVKFYRDLLGLKVSYPSGGDLGKEPWVALDAGSSTLALHEGGPGETHEHAPSIVFMTADVEASRAKLVAKGVGLGEVTEPHPGVKLCSGQDPDGHTFFLRQASI
ncbi:MAG: VOC family protein [Armatimonadetes bacterium]|nr:VOC family protein [Armatimonadota bacterium]